MSTIILITSVILLGLFLIKPKIGLYLLAFTLPVIGFDLFFASFTLPLVDLIALILLIAFILRQLFNFFFIAPEKPKLRFPLLIPFSIFLLISFISSVLSVDPMYSIWYFIRWPLFLYLAYILVPFNLIRDRKTLKYVLITITFSSLIVLVFGFLSLYGQDITNSVFRIRSIPFFGVYPFGQNHNLIAEFLNIGTFFILSLRALAKSVRFKRFLDVVFILSAIGIILTFSRTAWIVLALQSLVYIWLYFKDRRVNKKQIVVPIIILVLMFIPFIFKMENIQEENTSSTDNRLMLTQISLEAFKEKPLIGHGSGEYIRQVEKNIRFRAKYGEPIDSHGILQKVLTENGILGFVSWIFIVLVLSLSFYSALLKYRKKAPWLPPLIIGSMGGLIFQFLNTSYYKGKVWLPIVITLLAIQLLETDSKRKERGEER